MNLEDLKADLERIAKEVLSDPKLTLRTEQAIKVQATQSQKDRDIIFRGPPLIL